ncbi:MAG: AMP-binding protein [Bacteroidales bacterium]|nr:AMP-binding protein [Bacteroidales bacterium]
MKAKRLIQSIAMLFIRNGRKRASWLKKHHVLGGIGENCYWGPTLMPLYPELIKLHNNVIVHGHSRLVPHDMVNAFLKRAVPHKDFGPDERLGCIEIMDNVYIAAGSRILPNVRINKNCIISAGSVVTQDVPENSVVAGAPAKVIGRFDMFVASRLMNKDHSYDFKNQLLPPEIAAAEWDFFMNSRQSTALQDTSSAMNTDGLDAGIEAKVSVAVREKIIQVLSEGVSGIDFEKEKQLVTNGIFDSMSLITVVGLLEEAFSCKIPFEKVNADNFNSVDGMAVMLLEIGAQNQAAQPLEKEPTTSSFQGLGGPIAFDEAETWKPIVQRILEHAQKSPDDIAVIANDHETTYREFADMIYSISVWLKAKGVKQGDHVVVQASHEVTCPACWYAIHLVGAATVPVEKTAPESRILEIATATDASFVIAKKASSTKTVSWSSYDDFYAIEHECEFTAGASIVYPDVNLTCDIVFTTGTTGKSKGVILTHRQQSLYTSVAADGYKLKKNSRFLVAAPLNHVGGIRSTHFALANGCCAVYLEGMSDLVKLFAVIEKHHVTSLFLPPASIRIIINRTGDKFSMFKHQIDFVSTGSSPLFASDCNGLRKLLPYSNLYNTYQATEVPGGTAYNYANEDFRANCIGKPVRTMDVTILTEDGRFTKEAGVEGQICAKSEMVMKGYYNEPELTKSVFKDGWFVSSDIGRFDEDGYLYYIGRKDDVINLGGYKIAPTDVESLALQSGLVHECICIEDSDDYGVPFIKLLVVVADKSQFDPKALNTFLSDKLEKYKIPRAIEAVDALMKTYNGKIDRKAYRKSCKEA